MFRLQINLKRCVRYAEPAYWIWDGVSPTEAGHGIIADQWMKIVLDSGILGFKE